MFEKRVNEFGLYRASFAIQREGEMTQGVSFCGLVIIRCFLLAMLRYVSTYVQVLSCVPISVLQESVLPGRPSAYNLSLLC